MSVPLKQAYLAVSLCLIFTACGDEANRMTYPATNDAAASLSYPDTRRESVVDSYFGTEVADPYRWLEDDLSEETGAWVMAQNQVTQAYLEQIPFRQEIAGMYRRLLDYEREGAPFFEGAYRYFYRNDGLQNQSVLFRQAENGEAEVFLDPNGFSDDGTVSMSGVSFSQDGSLVAYQLFEGGSDWRSIVVRDVETGDVVGEPLQQVKFSAIAWRRNEGFYYSSYDKPDGSELSARTDQHKVYFHRVGTNQADDELVFGGTDEEKHRYVEAYVTEDQRFLWIEASDTSTGNRLFLRDLSAADGELFPLVASDDSDASIVDSVDDVLYIETNKEAPNGRLVSVNVAEPAYAGWEDVIPERDQVLSVSAGGGFFFATYMMDVMSHVEQFDRDGRHIRDIDLPDLGTASGFSGKKNQSTLYFSFTNHRYPTSIFSLDTLTGQTSLYRASNSTFDTEAYVTSQVFYESRDGTRVPMTITHAVDLELDGNNPTLLYGYGGFNISLQPSFSSSIALWLELGGVYAVPNIRGGGEYGKTWHRAGTLEQKQNVFDDFIAAAEYLKEAGYTRKERLALYGGSNGGLLVAAVLTQRPDLFQVALPAVGVLDMLRYHSFTSGAGWAYDYGIAEDSESMFQYLLGYSPLHNIEDGVSYPATLVTTGDHDDRVVPAHSFKFAAQLQRSHDGAAPVLIRIETDAGHGAGMPISKAIDLYADQYGFALYNMGIEGLPRGS